jgi:hypothetical protein
MGETYCTEQANYYVKLAIAEALPDLDRDLKHLLKETPVGLIDIFHVFWCLPTIVKKRTSTSGHLLRR